MDKIKNAIEILEDAKIGIMRWDMSECYDTAIYSLQAWEEVLQELENFDTSEYLKDEGHRFGCNEGICYALELINQKLAVVEKGEE